MLLVFVFGHPNTGRSSTVATVNGSVQDIIAARSLFPSKVEEFEIFMARWNLSCQRCKENGKNTFTLSAAVPMMAHVYGTVWWDFSRINDYLGEIFSLMYGFDVCNTYYTEEKKKDVLSRNRPVSYTHLTLPTTPYV